MNAYLSHSSISRNRCCPQGMGGEEDEKNSDVFLWEAFFLVLVVTHFDI